MKAVVTILFVALVQVHVQSQDLLIPKNYDPASPEDYTAFEQNVIDCVDWLMQTPSNEQAARQKEVTAFLIKWLSGSPDVIIEIKQEVVTFLGSTPNLLIIYMGGWAKYSLETRDFTNKVECCTAGIEAVISFYLKNRQYLKKDRNVEKYIKLKEEGKLREFIEINA